MEGHQVAPVLAHFELKRLMGLARVVEESVACERVIVDHEHPPMANACNHQVSASLITLSIKKSNSPNLRW